MEAHMLAMRNCHVFAIFPRYVLRIHIYCRYLR